MLWQSWLVAKLSMRVTPSAMALSIAKRWEMDLSPGNCTRPDSRVVAGRIVMFMKSGTPEQGCLVQFILAKARR